MKYLGNSYYSPDSIIARKIIDLYMNYGFPFVRVRVQHGKNYRMVIIREGSIVKLWGVVIKPLRYHKLISILPRIKGKTFSKRLMNKIKNRINSFSYIELSRLKFIKREDKVFLVLYIKEIYPPNSLNSAISITSRDISGYFNLSIKNFNGRPISFTADYNSMKNTRRLNICLMIPYLLRFPFGVYADYTSEIVDTTNNLSAGGGFNYHIGSFEISNGVEKDIFYGKGMILGNFKFKYSSSRFRSYLELEYAKNHFRSLLKIHFKSKIIDLRFEQFNNNNNSYFKGNITNGFEFLRGYEYGSIHMSNGWVVGLDIYFLKRAFLFGDYGEIHNNRYKSAGIGFTTAKGLITYGVHPGIPWYDGILSISLKIAL